LAKLSSRRDHLRQSGGWDTNNTGIVFELSPNSDGTWTGTLLHRFGPAGSTAGNGPENSLYLDPSGNLIGTAGGGGDDACYPVGGGCGLIFKIVR
jgi:hypothetical protein